MMEWNIIIKVPAGTKFGDRYSEAQHQTLIDAGLVEDRPYEVGIGEATRAAVDSVLRAGYSKGRMPATRDFNNEALIFAPLKDNGMNGAEVKALIEGMIANTGQPWSIVHLQAAFAPSPVTPPEDEWVDTEVVVPEKNAPYADALALVMSTAKKPEYLGDPEAHGPTMTIEEAYEQLPKTPSYTKTVKQPVIVEPEVEVIVQATKDEILDFMADIVLYDAEGNVAGTERPTEIHLPTLSGDAEWKFL
jgi:hypothetical protein